MREEELHYTAENKEAKLIGRVPCVVQLPFQDYLDEHISDRKEYNIALAEFGLFWVDKIFQECDPDVFMGTGIEGLVNHPVIKEKGFHASGDTLLGNPAFASFSDPRGMFDIYSCIPLVMVVDTEQAKGRSEPKAFSDLLSGEFENSIAFPDDGHMFDGIILTYIHQVAGDEGIRRLRKNICAIVHPSQMIKPGGIEGEKPYIYLMPWIFGEIKARQKGMKLIWFSDGAPILPLVVTSKSNPEAERIMSILCRKEAGRIFREKGFFPSNITGVDNALPGSLRFVGWEYLYDPSLPEIIQRCKKIMTEEK